MCASGLSKRIFAKCIKIVFLCFAHIRPNISNDDPKLAGAERAGMSCIKRRRYAERVYLLPHQIFLSRAIWAQKNVSSVKRVGGKRVMYDLTGKLSATEVRKMSD